MDTNESEMMALAALLGDLGVKAQVRPHPAHVVSSMYTTGSHQVLATSPRGQISIIRGPCSFDDYEIYSMRGDLFGDIERFETADEAAKAVRGYLED